MDALSSLSFFCFEDSRSVARSSRKAVGHYFRAFFSCRTIGFALASFGKPLGSRFSFAKGSRKLFWILCSQLEGSASLWEGLVSGLPGGKGSRKLFRSFLFFLEALASLWLHFGSFGFTTSFRERLAKAGREALASLWLLFGSFGFILKGLASCVFFAYQAQTPAKARGKLSEPLASLWLHLGSFGFTYSFRGNLAKAFLLGFFPQRTFGFTLASFWKLWLHGLFFAKGSRKRFCKVFFRKEPLASLWLHLGTFGFTGFTDRKLFLKNFWLFTSPET